MSEKAFFKIEKQDPKPNAKTYRIETVQDIVEVVDNDNLEKFLFELELVLRSAILMKCINDEVNEKNGTDNKIELPYFDWTDD